MKIRNVKEKDYDFIDHLVYEAFSNSEHGYNDENNLVHKLRKEKDYDNDFEIVVENDNGHLVGHAMLSSISINYHQGQALSPISVIPTFQNYGIGGLLINELERRALAKNVQFISILGSPEYYSRFGYLPASNHKIFAPFEVDDKYFMIKPLSENGLSGVSGVVEYNQAFN